MSDEATAALDPETEQEITDLVDPLAGTRTVIRLAHRIETTRNCRRIIVLVGGRIARTGTFEQLRADNEMFCSLAMLDQAA